jgi:hypothetical protein
MRRRFFIGETRSIAVILFYFTLISGSLAWGGEAERFVRNPETENLKTRRITLSLRIAEAKGEGAGRKYFRSLLRQNKRKGSVGNLSGQSVFLQAH